MSEDAWDIPDERATRKQRRALYRFRILRREVIRELSRDEAAAAIDFCLALLRLKGPDDGTRNTS